MPAPGNPAVPQNLSLFSKALYEQPAAIEINAPVLPFY